MKAYIFIIFLSIIIFYIKNQNKEIKLSKRVKEWEKQGNYTKIKEHEIFYIQKNKNKEKTILLIHGYPGSSYDFHKIYNNLDDYQIILFDLLGYGLR
jgi:pimeloyl-ACP methyl ester carboxylesterase